ncbi:hypothetical protein H1P_1560015 [Hyella patelloides LEGE 07179]|uniref:Uncharacterized protein n=1 Tax=Hyella patelloides LEGE 07179 TaxID=945734 RepID=A0A563VMV2_9CYAN|nr:hypothetical protein H1P_1560015 [Hyella patelloides LEGE 07179]
MQFFYHINNQMIINLRLILSYIKTGFKNFYLVSLFTFSRAIEV